MEQALGFAFRWAHVIFGITWIGMLCYFNFVQTEYFKEAEADAKSDAMKKLAPRALWWFRWGAMFTFLTGLYLLHFLKAHSSFAGFGWIWTGALAGTFMASAGAHRGESGARTARVFTLVAFAIGFVINLMYYGID